MQFTLQHSPREPAEAAFENTSLLFLPFPTLLPSLSYRSRTRPQQVTRTGSVASGLASRRSGLRQNASGKEVWGPSSQKHDVTHTVHLFLARLDFFPSIYTLKYALDVPTFLYKDKFAFLLEGNNSYFVRELI